jgi:hypothetical protein
MAIIEWNGATGDFNLGTNWVGSVAPGVADTALFNQGSQDVDTDVTTIAALDGFVVYPTYTGTLGGSGNEITSSINFVKHFGSSALWLKDAAGTTDDVFIQCADASTAVNLGSATMTRVTLNRGNVTIAADMGTIALLAVGQVSSANDCNVTITTGAGTVTEYIQRSGTVTAPNTITDGSVGGGILNKTGTTSVTNLNAYPGSTVNYKSSGTITWLRGFGGFVDLGDKALTVTNAVYHPGFRIKYDPKLVTFTNTPFDLRES